jgi:hypothetical protein
MRAECPLCSESDLSRALHDGSVGDRYLEDQR